MAEKTQKPRRKEESRNPPSEESTSQTPMDDPATRKRYEDAQQHWEEIGRPIAESVRESETLDEEDLAIRINARD